MTGDAVKVTGIDLALQAATEFRGKFPDPIKRPAMNRCVRDSLDAKSITRALKVSD